MMIATVEQTDSERIRGLAVKGDVIVWTKRLGTPEGVSMNDKWLEVEKPSLLVGG